MADPLLPVLPPRGVAPPCPRCGGYLEREQWCKTRWYLVCVMCCKPAYEWEAPAPAWRPYRGGMRVR